MSTMTWARSWPLGASTSTWTPDLEIWFLSSTTSCQSRETWGEITQGLWSVRWLAGDSRSRGSSWGKRAPPSRLRSRPRCSSCSCWCRQWLSSAQWCRPPQTDGSPSRCQTCWRERSTEHVTAPQSWYIPHLLPSDKQHASKTRTNESDVLYFKVVSSETGVVNLEDQTSVVFNAVKDLDGEKKRKNPLVNLSRPF